MRFTGKCNTLANASDLRSARLNPLSVPWRTASNFDPCATICSETRMKPNQEPVVNSTRQTAAASLRRSACVTWSLAAKSTAAFATSFASSNPSWPMLPVKDAVAPFPLWSRCAVPPKWMKQRNYSKSSPLLPTSSLVPIPKRAPSRPAPRPAKCLSTPCSAPAHAPCRSVPWCGEHCITAASARPIRALCAPRCEQQAMRCPQ